MPTKRFSISGSIASFFNNGTKNVKEKESGSSEKGTLKAKAEREHVTKGEKQRKADIEMKRAAAETIQRAWRKHRRTKRKHLEKNVTNSPQRAVTLRRLQMSQAEWEKEIAALTIQLAWRKFFRRKLLKSLNPNRRQLRMWDPEIVALKQQALIAEIYSEQLMVPFWHPTLKAPVRPFWFHWIPSPAAVSFNFAVDQYHPLKSWQGMRPHSWTSPIDDGPTHDYVPHTVSSFRPERSHNSQFSYNLRKT